MVGTVGHYGFNVDELLGILDERERMKKDGFEPAVNCRVPANAQGQRENCDSCETRTFREHPDSVTNVLQQCLHSLFRLQHVMFQIDLCYSSDLTRFIAIVKMIRERRVSECGTLILGKRTSAWTSDVHALQRVIGAFTRFDQIRWPPFNIGRGAKARRV